MTIHPPLPALASDRPMEPEVWRDSLMRLLEDSVRGFPDQCPFMVLTRPRTKS